jgi:hypothetical protein
MPARTVCGSPSRAERLGARVDGWNIDLIVLYGDGDPAGAPHVPSEPSVETRTAQEQLARLAVPPAC